MFRFIKVNKENSIRTICLKWISHYFPLLVINKAFNMLQQSEYLSYKQGCHQQLHLTEGWAKQAEAPSTGQVFSSVSFHGTQFGTSLSLLTRRPYLGPTCWEGMCNGNFCLGPYSVRLTSDVRKLQGRSCTRGKQTPFRWPFAVQ